MNKSIALLILFISQSTCTSKKPDIYFSLNNDKVVINFILESKLNEIYCTPFDKSKDTIIINICPSGNEFEVKNKSMLQLSNKILIPIISFEDITEQYAVADEDVTTFTGNIITGGGIEIVTDSKGTIIKSIRLQ